MGLDTGHVHDHGQASGAAQGNTPEQRHRAARTVASWSVDAVEAADLLGMLGLTARDGMTKGASA